MMIPSANLAAMPPSTFVSGGIFPGYVPNPYSPPRPNTPPIAGPSTGSGCNAAPDVPLAVFRAAQEAGASHLSADGKYIYTVRYGKVLQAKWNGARFGSWLDIGEQMPPDAVKI